MTGATGIAGSVAGATGVVPSVVGAVIGAVSVVAAASTVSVGAACITLLVMFKPIASKRYTTNAEIVAMVRASPVRPPNAVSVPPPPAPPNAPARPPPCGRCTKMMSTSARDTMMKRTVKTENRTLIGTSVDVQSTSLTQTQEHAADTIAKKSSHFSDAPPMSPPSTSSQAKSSAAFFAFTDPP